MLSLLLLLTTCDIIVTIGGVIFFKKIKILMMVFLCGFIILSLTGCGNKQAITSSDFKSKMQNKGFDVQEATDQFVNYEYIKQVYIAVNNRSNHQIEFYEKLDTIGAESFYETNKEVLKNEKGSSSVYSLVTLGNHSKFF